MGIWMVFALLILSCPAFPDKTLNQNPYTPQREAPAIEREDAGYHIRAGIAAAWLTSAAAMQVLNFEEGLIPAFKISAMCLLVSAVAGISKEILDAFGLGAFEVRDILNTFLGGFMGSLAVLYAYRAFEGQDLGYANRFFSLGGMGLSLAILLAFVLRQRLIK